MTSATYFIPVPPDTLSHYGGSVPALVDATGDRTAVDGYDLALLSALDLDQTIGVWRGWRVSLHGDSASAARMYVVETEADAQSVPAVASAARAALLAEGDSSSQVEVYGPEVPLSEQAWAARAQSALIWAAAAPEEVRLAEVDGEATAVELDEHERAAVLDYLRLAVVVAAPPGGPAVHTDGRWVWPDTIADRLERHGTVTDSDLLAHVRAGGVTPDAVDAVAAHRALAALHRATEALVVDDTAAPAPAEIAAGAQEGMTMDAGVARERAAEHLARVQDPATPLRLSDEAPAEYPWCWVFDFNAEQWFRTREFTDGVASGPVVVDKDGGDVWIAPSAPPLEEWLNVHAARRGFEAVPVPRAGSPW
ncbi:YrhB family protein [Actinoplanes sp. NPDC049316]|uniref:YrhB family protein n=1 Tax=Actinoplanes sp. NPDC049316 TaxID=3154727 RepID=UPI003435713E